MTERLDEAPRLGRDIRSEPVVDRRAVEAKRRELIEIERVLRQFGVEPRAHIGCEAMDERRIRCEYDAARWIGLHRRQQTLDFDGAGVSPASSRTSARRAAAGAAKCHWGGRTGPSSVGMYSSGGVMTMGVTVKRPHRGAAVRTTQVPTTKTTIPTATTRATSRTAGRSYVSHVVFVSSHYLPEKRAVFAAETLELSIRGPSARWRERFRRPRRPTSANAKNQRQADEERVESAAHGESRKARLVAEVGAEAGVPLEDVYRTNALRPSRQRIDEDADVRHGEDDGDDEPECDDREAEIAPERHAASVK